MIRPTLRATLALPLGILLLLPATLAAQADEPRADRVVADGGAKLRNLADPAGLVLETAAAGTPLRVVREKAGWLEVEPPGGFPVWVFGRFLADTTEAGVLEVTANGVNMRPRPNSDVTNFPLSRALHRGDRVRVLGRDDASKPRAEDWVRVRSPIGATAWVRAGEAAALPAGADAVALWNEGLARVMGRPADPPAPVPETGGGETDPVDPPAPETEREAQILEALEAAEAVFARERDQAMPDFEAVREAYGRVLDLEPRGVNAVLAEQRLDAVEALEMAQRIEARFEEERLRRRQELIRRQEEIWEESRRKDPLGARFDSRGRLERRAVAGEEARYFVVWRGDVACEVRCGSGRYDLELFAGREVGVFGDVVAGVRAAEDASSATPAVVDVRRIEVLSTLR